MTTAVSATTTAADFVLPGLKGGTISLADHAGPILVVNTASLCGFTSQYAGLQLLHETYAGRGLLVLAVPSNDFGKQEPGDAAAIGQVCDARFRITFPVAAKAVVSGPDVRLSWTANTEPDIKAYRVYRREGTSTTRTMVGTTTAGDRTFTDAARTPGTNWRSNLR